MDKYIPNLIEAVTGIITGAAAAVLAWGQPVGILINMMILDYITGIIAAAKVCELSSRRGFSGLLKKIVTIMIVGVAHIFAGELDFAEIYTAVGWFYVGIEGLSILENASRIGVHIPRFLASMLDQMSEQKEYVRRKEKRDGKSLYP